MASILSILESLKKVEPPLGMVIVLSCNLNFPPVLFFSFLFLLAFRHMKGYDLSAGQIKPCKSMPWNHGPHPVILL